MADKNNILLWLDDAFEAPVPPPHMREMWIIRGLVSASTSIIGYGMACQFSYLVNHSPNYNSPKCFSELVRGSIIPISS